MPTNITIREIPDEIYKRLKEQAELNRRSINSEVIHQLERLVRSHRPDPDLVISQAKKLRRQAKGTLTMDEIQHAIESGRP